MNAGGASHGDFASTPPRDAVDYRQLIDVWPDIALVFATSGDARFCNPAWTAYSGLSAAETTFENWAACLHPDDREAGVSAWRAGLAAGNPFTCALRLRRRSDGDHRWHSVRMVPIRDRAPAEIACWLAAAIDEHDRRTSAAALDEMTSRLVFSMTTASMGSWIFDPHAQELLWTSGCARLYGLPEGSSAIADFLGCMHPDDRQRVLAVLQPSHAGDFAVDYRITRGDGAKRWLNSRGRRNDDAGHIVGVTMDVTDRVQAERERAEHEAIYRTLVESAAEGIWKIDAAERTVFVNRAMCDMLGYEPEEMLGRRVTDFLVPELRAVLMEKLQRRRAGADEIARGIDFSYLRKDGSIIHAIVSVNPFFEQSPGGVRTFTGALALITDVTARHEAERKLRESHRLLAFAEDLGAMGSWEWNLESNLIQVSDAVMKILGTGESPESLQEAIGLLHPDDRPRVADLTRRVVEEHANVDFVARILRPDASVRHIAVRGEVSETIDGRRSLARGIVRDVTAERTVERELQALSGRLLELQEAERAHVARELHDELGQLLTGLRLRIASARPHVASSADAVSALAAVDRAIDQMLAAVHRISADLRPPALDDLGLAETIDVEARRFESDTGIETILTLDAGCLSFASENAAIEIYRIFQEALTNVARHSFARQVRIEATIDGGVTRLKIRDDGVGFQPDAVQLARSLGLLGMRERAAHINAVLRITSTPGGGTIVELSVPRGG